MLHHNRARATGLTLVELLVVLAITALLLALLLPAVQKLREAANRMKCTNNLKQIGLGVQGFHDSHQALPPDRIRNEWATWAVLILPHLEQPGIFNQWDLQLRYWDQPGKARMHNVNVYFCPSRRAPSSASFSKGERDRLGRYPGDFPGGRSDYASCGGNDNDSGALMIARARGVTPSGQTVVANANRGVFNQTPAGTRILSWQSMTNLANITDGTSNTVLIGEKFVQKKNLNGMGEDRSVFHSANPGPYRRLLGVRGQRSYTLVSDVNADLQTWPNCHWSFGGVHPGLCQFVMVDGSVRALRTTLTNPVLQYLGQRNDGQVIAGLD